MNSLEYNLKLEEYQRFFLIKIFESIEIFPIVIRFINFEVKELTNENNILEYLELKNQYDEGIIDIDLFVDDRNISNKIVDFFFLTKFLFSIVEIIIILDNSKNVIFETFDYFECVDYSDFLLEYKPPTFKQ